MVGGARSERIRVVRVRLFRFRDGRVGEISAVLLLVLVEPEDEVEVLSRILLEDEVALD